MILNMSFKHIEPQESVKRYATTKSEKLKKFFRGKISVTWNFTKEKQDWIAHCHLVGNRMDYFSETAAPDLYSSIDLVIDKINKQVKRHKEIVKNHLHRGEHTAESSNDSVSE